jgi:mRNA interferase RelE/StbE
MLLVPTWKVELIPEAKKDFKTLDGHVRKLILKQLLKLEKDPRYGEQLGNKAGIDLSGYCKLYADQKRVRIVYEVIEPQHLIRVIAIDTREDLEVYQIALKRLQKMEK